MPISANVVLGQGVQIFHPDLVNLYGCSVDDETKIGSFVEIQGTAERRPFTEERLAELIRLARVGLAALRAEQDRVLEPLLAGIARG